MLAADSGRAAKEMSISGVPIDTRRVRVPVLVVTGDDDRFIPAATSHSVAALYHAALQTMPGHGHMLVVEPGWQMVADTVARWAIGI